MDATTGIKEGGAKQDLAIQKANAELQNDRGIADRLRAGGNVSNADQQNLIASASKIAGHNVDLNTAALMIEAGANNMGAFMNQLRILTGVLGKFTPEDAAQLQREIDDIKKNLVHHITTTP